MKGIMRYPLVVTIYLLLFVTCAIGQTIFPSTEPGAPPVPAAAGAPQRGGDIPRQLTLERAEELLIQNNLAIIASRYGVDIARAQRLLASLKPNPTLSVSAEQFSLTNPLSHLITETGTAANRFYTIRYDQIFERGGKRELRTEVADLQLKASEAQVLDTIRQQGFQLKQAFYTAVLARENLRTADENLYLTRGTEQLIKLHVTAGDTAEWDLIKFQAGIVQFQRDLVTSQLSYQQSVRDLLNLMGSQPSGVVGTVTTSTPSGPSQMPQLLADAPLDVVGDLHIEPVKVSLDDLRQEALTSRPDVVAAQRNAEAAQRSLQLANALRRRDFDVGWEYQRNGGDDTFGFTFSVPLFVHNNHQAEINIAKSQLDQASAQLNQVKLQAMTDVDKAFRAYEMSQKLLQIYTGETLARAQESLDIANVSYKQGASSLLELQDAQRTYNATRVASNQAHFDYRMSLYQLEQATGKQVLK
jgi:cobalt-zinc-cadmium efflux system outer membrane protein